MSDLLKEAIADAKAVRETALQNAKMALEEAFTPQLKSMLSAKLREDDMEDEEEFSSEEGEEEFSDKEPEEGYYEDEEAGEEEPTADGGEENPFPDEEEPEVDESKIIEIDGVQYAPIVAEDEGEEGHGHDDEEEEGDLDLEAVIKELEDELSESEESVEESTDEVDEEIEIDETILDEDEDEDEDKDEVDEVDKSSSIGNGTGRGDTDKSSGIGNGNNSLKEVQSELKEYKEAVKFLKDKLHEVNILNAKLLFTNKLFKEFTLDNNQKLKVVETFDRAQTTREIKLVYSTLAEQFGDNGSIKRKSLSESASSAVSSTKPSKESLKVITEEEEVVNRFRKLAGLIKG